MAGSRQGQQKGRVAKEDGALRCGYLYLDHLIETEAVDQFDIEASFVHKFNKILFTLLSQICPIDLVNRNHELEPDTSDDDNNSNNNNVEEGDKMASSERTEDPRPKLTLFKKCVLCLHCLFTCHLLISLYYQYSYDLNLVGLMSLQTLNINSSACLNLTSLVESYQIGERHDASELELKLLNRMQASKLALNAIGSRESWRSIAIEFRNICVIFVSLVVFGFAHLYYCYVTPFDLYHFREQIDYKGERKLVERLVAQTVSKYCKSEELFRELSSKYSSGRDNNHQHLCHITNGGEISDIWISCCATSDKWAYNLSAGHNQVETTGPMLRMMLTSGALMPFNRSPNWTRLRELILFSYELFTLTFVNSFYAALVYASSDAQFTRNLAEVSDRGLVLMISIGASTLGVSYFVIPIDQIFLVNNLTKLIKQCIQINSAEFEHYNMGACRQRQQMITSNSNDQHRHQDESESFKTAIRESGQLRCCSCSIRVNMDLKEVACNLPFSCQQQEPTLKMNANMLFTLMHFKIFVRQLKPIIRTLNTAAIINYAILLLFPIAVRVNMPYLRLFQAQDNRLILAAICASVLLPVNAGALYVCHLNARCNNLYRSLSSLIAHIIEIETHHKRSIYDLHAVSIVLKELRDPNRFTDQFITRCAGVSGTYSTLVRVHFWWGLIMISILIGTKSTKGGMLDALLDDPFGAFSVII